MRSIGNGCKGQDERLPETAARISERGRRWQVGRWSVMSGRLQGRCRVIDLGTMQVAFALSHPFQLEILGCRLGLLLSQTLQRKPEDRGHTPGIRSNHQAPFAYLFRRWEKRTSTIIAKTNCQCLSSNGCYVTI